MKKIFSLLLFLPVALFSQAVIGIGKDYVFTVPTPIYDSDIHGLHNKTNYTSPPVGSKFQVLDETDTTYIISFYMWKLPKDKTGEYQKLYDNQLEKIKRYNLKTVEIENTGISIVNANDPNVKKYFVVYKLNLDKKCVSYDDYSRWRGISGALVFPFKLRPQNGDFTKDLTVNGIVGAGYRITKNHTLNGMLGLGIASVTLDSLNTKGKVPKSSDRAAISANIGLLYQYKQIQLGAVIGWDFLNQSTADGWIHNRKYWLGFGVGINLFKDDKATETPKVDN